MDTEPNKFNINEEYFQNFPISPDHYVITTNSDTNSLDWNVPSNQSADYQQEIPSELLCFVERLQQEVHSLDKQCRECQLDADESKLELRNMELELELSKQEVNREREERKRDSMLANEVRSDIEEKLTCSQGDVVQLEKKLDNFKNRDQKYKNRNQLLQKSLIEFQEQIKELDARLVKSDRSVNQLTREREQLINELSEANCNAEFLANQNQELEQEVTWHKDELVDTRESLNHLQKEYEFQSLRQTVTCADEVSLMDEIGHEGVFGGPIILQTDPDSADEQTAYCTENESYHCVPACQYNCANYKQRQPLFCGTLSCIMGCGCKDGFVRKSGIEGECVLKPDCEPRTTQPTTISTVSQTITPVLTNTTSMPTPITCPVNSHYADCACPLNCSFIVPVPIECARKCEKGCECHDGFVLLQGECIEQASCPVAGSVEFQRDTTQPGKVSGSLRLFTNGNWYNICSDGIKSISNDLHEFSCEYLNFPSLTESYYETTSKTGLQTVQLECENGALAVTQCNYTQTDICRSILNIACLQPSVTSPIVGVVTGVGVILLLIAIVLVVLIVVAVVTVMMIRRKNQARSYKQFDARLSVVSDPTDPIDEPAGIANPIYQTKDLETEQLISDDDDVLTN